MLDLFIHLGLPKTGTTFFQKRVLPKCSDIKALVKPRIKVCDGRYRLARLFNCSPTVWSEVNEEDFADMLGLGSSNQPDNCLISDEAMFGGVMSPLPWILVHGDERDQEPILRVRPKSDATPFPSSVSLHLKRLKELALGTGFSNLNILMTIRRQDSLLASTYAQFSHRVKGASQKGFQRWCRAILERPAAYHFRGGLKLDYSLWWEELSRVVDTKNIKIIPFELLCFNQDLFFSEVASFLSSEDMRNISYELSDYQKGEKGKFERKKEWKLAKPIVDMSTNKLKRLLKVTNMNNIYNYFAHLLRNREKKISLTRELTSYILDTYENSNRNLYEKVKALSINKFRYF